MCRMTFGSFAARCGLRPLHLALLSLALGFDAGITRQLADGLLHRTLGFGGGRRFQAVGHEHLASDWEKPGRLEMSARARQSIVSKYQ
ncbi:protein of unknown function [Methylorubrum extorquens]|uniref:Uncharacterized protein n=1 Tax=Methylorubrum extorquens TaxID=408 RepID=A0A2N9AZC3_METEX|nr:protein of unknown function [Methylorubrum extorquens]